MAATVEKSKERKLLLLSKHFPFNFGQTPAESYLETEIVYLANRFDEVMILATEGCESPDYDCTLPENVTASALNIPNGKIEKLRIVLSGITLFFSGKKEELEARNSDKVESVVRKIFLNYYIRKASKKYTSVVRLLDSVGFRPTHVYSFWFFDTALLSCWLKRRYGCVSFSRAHRYDLYEDKNILNYLPCREYQLSNLDFVFPCSRDGLCYLIRTHARFEKKIVLSYLGTKDIGFPSKMRNGTFSVVSCSSLTPVKRVPLIARALQVLDKEGIKLKWTHYGSGPDFSEVQKEIASYQNVECTLMGSVSNSKIIDAYVSGGYDLFINVSSSEGLPISIMEACAVGLPILATNVGGTCEIVKEGVNGILVPEVVNENDIADAIRFFITLDIDEMAVLQRGSREIWSSYFRASKNILTMLKTID